MSGSTSRCPHCNAVISTSDKFCRVCGQPQKISMFNTARTTTSIDKDLDKFVDDVTKMVSQAHQKHASSETLEQPKQTASTTPLPLQPKLPSSNEKLRSAQVKSTDNQKNLDQKVRKHNSSTLARATGWLVLSISVLGLIYYFAWINNDAIEQTLGLKNRDIVHIAVGVAALFGIGTLLRSLRIFLDMLTVTCQTCGARDSFFEQVNKRERINRKLGYETVTRERKNSEGRVIDQWKEQVRVEIVTYRDYFSCSVCGHTYSRDREVRNQDFKE